LGVEAMAGSVLAAWGVRGTTGAVVGAAVARREPVAGVVTEVLVWLLLPAHAAVSSSAARAEHKAILGIRTSRDRFRRGAPRGAQMINARRNGIVTWVPLLISAARINVA
jgi:hypothetical protein